MAERGFSEEFGSLLLARFRQVAAADGPFAKFLFACLYLAIATILSAVAINRLGVPSSNAIYLFYVAIASYHLGARYGLFAAIAATLSYEFFIDTSHANDLNFRLSIFNIVTFSAAALLVGTFSELSRDRLAVMRSIGDETMSLAEAQSRSVFPARPGIFGSRSVSREVQRAAIAIGMCLLGLAFALFLHNRLHVHYVSAVLLATVTLIATLLGSRAGLLAAIFSTFAFDYFFVGVPYRLDLTSPQDLVNFAMFTASGWMLGVWGDRVRDQRQIIRHFLAAERNIFAAGDERSIRQVLRDMVRELLEIQAVWVLPQNADLSEIPRNQMLPGGVADLLRTLRSRQTIALGSWRLRRLGREGEDFGSIIWLSARMRLLHMRYRDWAVSLLADLATVAITQTRTSAQKMEADLVLRSDRLHAAMLSSISHDFRTPLVGILGSVTALIEQGDQHDEKQRGSFLASIRAQALQLNRYVENLLNNVRMDSGLIKTRFERANLEQIVYSAWDALSEVGGDARVLRVQIAEDATVNADVGLLTQVLQNVLENAIKFSPEMSTVTVRSDSGAGRLHLEILDEGPGIPPGDMPFVFERFYRGRSSTVSGTGLGLFIVKNMVEAMDGRVELRNRIDGKTGVSVFMSLKDGGSVS